jgi:two-component system response regulator AtoC
VKRARILVVDDKDNYLALFRRIVPADVEVVGASDGARALELLAAEPFDVVLSDVRMPGADGMTVLRKVREAGLDAEVILMTAYGTIADAVKAMKLGASEYLTKPFDPDDAVAAIESALERRRVRAAGPRRTLPATQLVGQSESMRRVLDLIARAAASDAPVLVAGESGTGKELVARTIHVRSGRSERRFVPVNCGALGDTDVEAELFGWVRGARAGSGAKRGSFEEAAGGSLFLDEVEALPLAVQVKVTRAIEERVIRRLGSTEEHVVDVRIIAATDIDISRAVEQGRFRAELYDRLNVLSIDLPALRERRDDIPLLADALLRRVSAGAHPPRSLSPDAVAALVACEWPGNVRQLENALARAVAGTPSSVLSAAALPDDVRAGARPRPRRAASLAALPYRKAIAVERERATREYVVALLQDVQGNVTQAAERAGIERESFHRLMKRHAVRAEDYRPKG